ncbi:MAG: NAD(P)/FAD-dependent oxidoreductase [Oscillospiraceae bacterium]|nr:NAD(P)/FAD-dependent oxidoreductase [Oscillospiraceae bacterium]
MDKKIVIVGAGYGGILAAKKLAKKFKKNENVNITLIDKNPFHTMLTELHEVAAGRVDEDSIRIDLKKVFAKRKVQILLDTVTGIDFEQKQVCGQAGNYEYDVLVLAAGSQPTYYGVSGAEEFAFKLWSYDDAVLLKDHILNCFRRAEKEIDLEEKKRLLTFYVVGSGFTGVEMVGELAEYVPILCDKFNINRELVSLHNVDVLPRPCMMLPERLSQKIIRRLQKTGVNIHMETNVTNIGADFIETCTDQITERHSVGTVIWTAGIESSDITKQAAQVLPSAGRGRIQVDSYLRSVDNEDVYVVGDNMMFVPKGSEKPVPQMVENCEQSSATATNNIVYAITGKGKMEEYNPSFHGVMVSIGGRYGVAKVGLPSFMFSLPSFLAMFAKHFINVTYFVQVLGWNKVFSYIKHEFFTIRNCRSFVGGHFSNRTPSFLLVPLRVWLGAVWVYEGVMKIIGGWFTDANLTTFFGGANSWFNSILNIGTSDGTSGATGAVTDAVSSATGVVTEEAAAIGTKIFDLNFGLFRAIFVSGEKLVDSTLADYAFKLDVPVMNWFIDKFILPYEGVQLFMQGFIVIAEILIGLALIGGLFSTPASAFSLVLQFMFVCTTGLFLGTFWMIFAAIAVLIGAGRTLGLDYYAMPFLKKYWRKLPLVRKWYIYHD